MNTIEQSSFPSVSFLVLDYKKLSETRDCLVSIREHAQFPHKVIYLDNGSNDDYPFALYKEGLCDVLLSKRVGNGGGVGQTDLFRFCDTEYAFFVQNDQKMVITLDGGHILLMASFLKEGGYSCIDLNGDQSRCGIWTDRAHFINVPFFNSLGPFPNGGPGNEIPRWNENYLQEIFEKRGYKIAHLSPVVFQDVGKWSVRQLPAPCNGISRHRTDTKQLWWDKIPEASHIFPVLTSEEWEKSIRGEWVGGDIPEHDKKHSFRCWD